MFPTIIDINWTLLEPLLGLKTVHTLKKTGDAYKNETNTGYKFETIPTDRSPSISEACFSGSLSIIMFESQATLFA
jgi:hypothetical protein